MQQFLVVVCCMIILGMCVVSGFGFWYFVNSSAAEAQAWKIVDSVSNILEFVGKGLLFVLICGGIFLLCSGVKQAAEPVANATGTVVLAKAASRNIRPNSGIKTPHWEVWPPPDSTQLRIPEREIIGGDLPIRDVRLLESERQT